MGANIIYLNITYIAKFVYKTVKNKKFNEIHLKYIIYGTKMLVLFCEFCYNIRAWGISSVGRALHWQCRGQRFESAMLHHGRHPSGCLFLWWSIAVKRNAS